MSSATSIPSAESRLAQLRGHIEPETASDAFLAKMSPLSGNNDGPALEPSPGAKMQFLIRRKPTTSREELVVNWFSNHMPQVASMYNKLRESGKPAPRRYIGSLFDITAAESKDARPAYDGVAQLWWPAPQKMPAQPFGIKPTDTFQEKAEPYMPWATREYVVLDNSDRIAPVPNTLNPPYPCTRSGFFKVTFLVGGRKGMSEQDYKEFFEHWLKVHAPNVEGVMKQVGGFRYVISQSMDMSTAPYAGTAELYFPSEEEWKKFGSTIKPDGMEKWTGENVVLKGQTEMIGIP